jgi:hypothetical protein
VSLLADGNCEEEEKMKFQLSQELLTIRHSNLHVTPKRLQAAPERKRLAQGKLVDAILPGGLLSANKSILIASWILKRAFSGRSKNARRAECFAGYWTHTDLDLFSGPL